MIKNCWKCHKEVPADLKHCPHCSVPLDQEMVDRMATVVEGITPTMQIIPGMLVAGRYEIKEKLGQGGMGVVYLAHDKVMDQDVAIKVVPPELSLDPVAAAELKQEVQTCQKLNHHNIIRVHNLERWQGQTFILMEYVAGETLGHLLAARGGKLPLVEALPLLKQIALALDYTHSQVPPVVHRDLKPQNIFLTGEGEVKVADFGLARALTDSATRVSRTAKAGSPAYMAPEQVMGKGVGLWSDVYALACTAYHLLAGHPPYHSGEIVYQIMEAEPEPVPGMPTHVNDALMAALSKDPQGRPGSASSFVAMLAGEKKVTAGGLGPGKKVSKAKSTVSQKKEVFLTLPRLALIATLLLLAGAGWYFFGKGVDKPVLTVSSAPAGATFILDDYEMGKTPFEVAKLADGPHKIKLSQERYHDYEEQVFVEQGKTAKIRADLKPLPIGDLSITSSPSGASVYLDGEKKGSTPLSLEKISKGTRLLEVKKNNYEAWQSKVEIKPLATARINADLVSLYGMLEISSQPAGAAVYLDGKKRGTTPLELSQVATGQRQLRVEKKCYAAKEKKVEIEASVILSKKIILANSCGELELSSSPSGASVYLAGELQGKTPMTLSRIEQGPGKLVLKKEGYQDWQDKVEIKALVTARVSADLKKKERSKFIDDQLTGMEFVWMKGGCFEMGSPDNEKDRRSSEGPAHEVCVDGFYMGRHEVTQDQWQKIMTTTIGQQRDRANEDWPLPGEGSSYPMYYINWDEAREYIEKLNKKSGKAYRLPSEAEWEYAARAGTKTPFSFGETISTDQANYNGNYVYGSGKKGVYRKSTVAVGSFPDNAWGLYDMHGNVWEWVSDCWHADYTGAPKDGSSWETGECSYRVNRGGGWYYGPWITRSAYRNWSAPGGRDGGLGFRLVLPPGQQASER